MIRFENVVKRYTHRGHTKWILRGLNLTLGRGRSIGVLGRNGAGKSTLIRMISGAEMPDFGRIVTNCRVSWPLGFAGTMSGSMTGHDACMFVARLYGADTGEVVDSVRSFSELGNYFFQPTNLYSSGMKARLSFGLSMAIQFDIYLIDELTAVGDSSFRQKCLDAFSERRKTADIIMVSHSDKTIRDYCDMGAILDDGEFRLFDDLDEAMSRYRDLMAA